MRKSRPPAVIRNMNLNSVALLVPLRSAQFSSGQLAPLAVVGYPSPLLRLDPLRSVQFSSVQFSSVQFSVDPLHGGCDGASYQTLLHGHSVQFSVDPLHGGCDGASYQTLLHGRSNKFYFGPTTFSSVQYTRATSTEVWRRATVHHMPVRRSVPYLWPVVSVFQVVSAMHYVWRRVELI